MHQSVGPGCARITRCIVGCRQEAGRLGPLEVAPVLMWAVIGLIGPAAHAQSSGVGANPTGPADPSVSERVKREAERVMHWIKLNADGPRKPRDDRGEAVRRPATKEATSPAAVAATPGARVPAAPDAAATARSPTAIPATTTPASGTAAAGAVPGAAPPKLPSPEAAKTAQSQLARSFEPPPHERSAVAGAPGPTQGPTQQVAMQSPAPPQNAAPVPEAANDELVILRSVEPEFSHSTMNALRKASAEVTFEVLPDGSVANVRIVRTTSARIVTPVLAAVSQWQFKPIRESRSATVEVGFNLD